MKSPRMSPVAYLGPEGTFSGILARRRFGANAALLPCPSIDAVFESVASGAAPRGLVPVENSSGGTVHDTIDLLIRHAGSIFITGELALDIRIALLGRKGPPPKTIYSHFTQIKHHSDWLKKHHPAARLVPVESTTTAASKAAESRSAAALASPGAAKIYGLEILETPGHGGEVNVTHFFTIARQPAPPAEADRTAFVAALKNSCGSLHRFLGPFARQGVSLTRIVSRPVPGQPQTYVFYIEIEGPATDSRVQHAMQLAARHARFVHLLGSFPRGRKYRS
jgi:chorismate mutase / prephenate dehydratase